jgi:hypothetical protein
MASTETLIEETIYRDKRETPNSSLIKMFLNFKCCSSMLKEYFLFLFFNSNKILANNRIMKKTMGLT